MTNFCAKMCSKSKKTNVTDVQNEYRSIKYYIEKFSSQQRRKCPFIVRNVKVNTVSSVWIKRNRVASEENTLNNNLLKLKRIYTLKLYKCNFWRRSVGPIM